MGANAPRKAQAAVTVRMVSSAKYAPPRPSIPCTIPSAPLFVPRTTITMLPPSLTARQGGSAGGAPFGTGAGRRTTIPPLTPSTPAIPVDTSSGVQFPFGQALAQAALSQCIRRELPAQLSGGLPQQVGQLRILSAYRCVTGWAAARTPTGRAPWRFGCWSSCFRRGWTLPER